VPAGGTGIASVTNNQLPGSLAVTKTVNWLTAPDTTQTFSICIQGPSYPTTPNCKTYTSSGGTQTWTGLIPGSYTVTESNPGTAWAVPVISGSPATVPAGGQGTATVTNNQLPGSLKVTKTVNWLGNPDTTQTFSICIQGPSYPTTPNCKTYTSGGGTQTWTNLIPGSYTVTESNPGTAWATPVIAGSPATVPAGGTGTATVTNNQLPADVTVFKTENGAIPTHAYSFSLTSGSNTPSFSQTLTTNSTNQGTLDFGELPPGNYTLCELAVPAGTHSTLQDPPWNGTLDTTTGNVCYSFVLSGGVNIPFHIDNTYPRGNALTIGYWKHWNSYNLSGNTGAPKCTVPKTGNKLMDCFLPVSLGHFPTLGTYLVSTPQQGWNVLSQPSGKYAENQLAVQLLAAELNVGAGADTCTAESNAISHANTLLAGIGYAGPPSSVVSSKYPSFADFVNTASTLNSYNNNQLC
jgi:hypothetical protein